MPCSALAVTLWAESGENDLIYGLLIDQLENTIVKGQAGYAFDAEAWIGTEVDRFWLKAKGGGEYSGPLDELELQAL